MVPLMRKVVPCKEVRRTIGKMMRVMPKTSTG